MFHSIRWRLVLSYIMLAMLTVTLVGVLAFSLVRRYVEQREMDHLTSNAEAVAHQAAPLIWPRVRSQELQELAEMSSFLGSSRVQILDGEGRVVADSAETDAGENPAWLLLPHEWRFHLTGELPQPFVVELPRSRQLALPQSLEQQLLLLEKLPPDTGLTLLRWQDDVWGGRFHFDVIEDPSQFQQLAPVQDAQPRSPRSVTIPIGEEQAPRGYVELSDAPDYTSEALGTTRRSLLLAAGGAMIMAVILGLVVSRGLAAPLRALTEVAGRMSRGDLASRAAEQRRDEIGQLAGQFNQMAERLEASFAELAAERDALRRFIADASHELRTPVTALRNFNTLQQGAAAQDELARAEFLAESEVQLDRLEWMISNLLDLSRLDAGIAALDRRKHDVGELLQAATSGFVTPALEKKLMLTVHTPVPPIQLYCDGPRVEMALSNLLDNAIRVTATGGQVWVGAGPSREGVRLWVTDTGPGIDPEDEPQIFERFYRGHHSHVAGSGLGLAITQSIIDAHGGRVMVESNLGRGSAFTIELPLA